MVLHALAVENYRSCKDVVLPLGALTLITGPNGSGKSNLYRSLRLLSDVAHGQAVASLAREGGIGSVQWAGPEHISRRMKLGEVAVQGHRRKHAVAVRMGFLGDQFSYAIEFGLPKPSRSAFSLDPEIKRESIWHGDGWSRRLATVERKSNLVEARDAAGKWAVVTDRLDLRESLLRTVTDPRSAPEAAAIRAEVQAWRFYDHFRTDRDAPARGREIGTFTPALAADGRDLASALQTIREIGHGEAFDAAVEDAFPGGFVEVDLEGPRFGIRFGQHGLLRTLDEGELSDGTLRYLLWLAALMTPRPPPLIVLNEPETSLHPDLLEPLGRLIIDASRRTQVWVVSHAPKLIEVLGSAPGCLAYRLERELGATQLHPEDGDTERVAELASAWRWPPR